MYQIIKDDTTGFINISESFSPTASVTTYFGSIGSEYTTNIYGLSNVLKFNTFTYSISGGSNNRYLNTKYRVSRDGTNFTNWQDINSNITNFPPFNPSNKMYINIKFTRVGSSTIGDLRLLDYSLDGSLDRTLVDGESAITLLPNVPVIIKPPFIYKVFKISDVEIISRGNISNLSIKYRFSQDYGRTVNDWEILTKENISTVRINPIRFFQIEYLLENKGITNVNVYDINLIGDFQNVTLDSQKTNLYGVRENCSCLMLGIVNGTLTSNSESNSSSDPSSSDNMLNKSCSTDSSLYLLTESDKQKLFQPYQQSKSTDFLNKISNDANAIFGHEVVYFITDPDKKGIDHTFHEYQLYNYVCEDILQVSVDGNNFPDNQITFNQFDLSLFDSFEIHIPKEEFKKSFGVDKRPSKEDFLWFCDINRMYIVEHAQPFRSFNNTSVYYKIMLKKYNQKANIIAGNSTIAEKVRELTKNSTINELFGLENDQDKNSIANKEQHKVLTKDKLRIDINVKINKELIENSTTILSKTNYEMSGITFSSAAISYRNMKNDYKVSDNIGFCCWFSINNYVVNDVYNFFNYFDDINNLGFKMNLESDIIKFQVNSIEYTMPLGNTSSNTADGILENTWYCYVSNLDQRNRKITQYLYKRNCDTEDEASYLNSTVLKRLYKLESDIIISEFELESTQANILASDMKLTNIRLFEDIIPESTHDKILNMSIIRDDSKYLVFADNANNQLVLPNFPLS